MAQSEILIDIKTLAKRLGLSPQTIRNQMSAGKWPLPPIRIGRRLRWRESEVNSRIAEGWTLPQAAGRSGNKP